MGTKNYRLFPEKQKHNIKCEIWLVADNTDMISGLQRRYSLHRRVHIVFVYCYCYYYEGKEMEVMCGENRWWKRRR